MPEWREITEQIHWQAVQPSQVTCFSEDLYYPGHAGVKGNNWADTLAGSATLTSDLLLRRSQMLRSLRHYLWAQSQIDHTLIAWRTEAWKEEELGNLPWKDKRTPLSIRRTLELFQKQCFKSIRDNASKDNHNRGNFWETGCSAYGLCWVQI